MARKKKALSLFVVATLLMGVMLGAPLAASAVDAGTPAPTEEPAPAPAPSDGGDTTVVVPETNDTTVIERTETTVQETPAGGINMWYIIGFGALVVIILLVALVSRGGDRR